MTVRCCVLAVLAACGRIHFDPLGAGDGGGDAQSNACAERVLGTVARERMAPQLAWSGSEYLVGWADEQQFSTQRLDADGAALAAPVVMAPVVPSGAGSRCNVIWTGSEWGLVWQTGAIAEIVLGRAAADGTELGTEVQVTNTPTTSREPGVAFSGTLYAVTWAETPNMTPEVMLAMFDAQAMRQGTDVTLAGGGSGLRSGPAVVFDGNAFVFVWGETANNARTVMFQRATAAGTPIGMPTSIHSSAGNSAPSIEVAFAGTRLGIVSSFGGGASFLLADVDGTVMLEQVLSTSVSSPRMVIAWNGTTFGVAWVERLGEVLFQEFGIDGAPLGNQITLATLGTFEHGLGIAFDANGDYAIVWGTLDHELRFVKICR